MKIKLFLFASLLILITGFTTAQAQNFTAVSSFSDYGYDPAPWGHFTGNQVAPNSGFTFFKWGKLGVIVHVSALTVTQFTQFYQSNSYISSKIDEMHSVTLADGEWRYVIVSCYQNVNCLGACKPKWNPWTHVVECNQECCNLRIAKIDEGEIIPLDQ